MAKSSTSKFYGTSRTKNNGHKTRREIVKDFVSEWTNKGKDTGYGFIKEDANRQPFIDDFLRRICGIEQPTKYIEYEKDVQVKDGNKATTKRIDGYVPSTKVMWEMKGSNKSLIDKIEQSGGKKLTPFEQAWRYSEYLPQSEKPRWIIISNFTELDIHDMDHPLDEPKIIKLSELTTKYKTFDFMVDATAQQIIDEKQLSIDAGVLVSKIYKELAHAYSLHADLNDSHIQKSLNMLIVRIVFLLYADDTGILGEENLFQNLIEKQSPDNVRQTLITLFDTLNKPENKRDPFLADKFKQFKYVNGGMFSDETVAIPQFTKELQRLIVDDAGKGFNWANISPTIFGAVFESTLNPDTRRKGGMHYTSIKNIHKVIDPLFLDDLNNDFDKIKDISNAKDRVEAAREFQDKISKLKFFDPACGSGNFLTETYLSLRKLENQCLRIIVGNNSALNLDSEIKVKVKIQNYYGIEVNDFAVSVARTAMWIAESQMWSESQNIIYSQEDFLPLDSNDSIYEGNALRMDWSEIVKPYELNYIMGNPPFVGAMLMSDEQRNDLRDLIGNTKGIGELDYVGGWYYKAAQYTKDSTVKCAFVSTNSITQGQQALILWKPLVEMGVSLNFAYTTFVWSNEAANQAAVFCVIVGFSYAKDDDKTIYDTQYIKNEDGVKEETIIEHKADNINQYLTDGPSVFIENRRKPISDVPEMHFGSMPRDGGYFFVDKEELKNIDDIAKNYIRKFWGAKEFLHNHDRYCLWLLDAPASDMNKSPFIRKRIAQVKEFRLASKAKSTREMAKTAYMFAQLAQPDGDYLIFPRHSSQNRNYIPLGLEHPNVIAGDSLLIVPNTNNYHFGVLESSVHMAWMKLVAGRIKGDYRYSKNVVYNNFPWPKADGNLKAQISSTAKAILDARANHPESNLANMYNPDTMPLDLLKAHEANDRTVLKAYGLPKDATDTDILQKLFSMYEKSAK